MEINIRKFYNLLMKYEDIPENYFYYESFLIQLSRTNQGDFPMVELMTVLKNTKPSIFIELQRNAHKNIYLEMIVSLDTEFEYAQAKLKSYGKK